MRNKRHYEIVGLIIGLVLLRGLIYGLLIPFDHAPDEKHHFLLIKAKQLQLRHASKDETQETAARIEVAWRYLLFPESPKGRFAVEQFRGALLPAPPSSLHLYYLVTGAMLNVLSCEQIPHDIYALRGISILCGALVVVLAIVIAGELFPDDLFLRFGIPIFIAFVPQFSAMNGVINNDKLAEVFASLLLWLLVKIFKHGLTWQYSAAYAATAILALMSKRTTIFIIPLTLLAFVLYFWKGRLGLRLHLALFGGIIGVTLLVYLLLWNETIYTLVHDHVISIPEARYLPKKLLRPELFSSATLLHIAKFFIVMYWGFWGIFGYMTIHLHHFWYLLAAFAQSLSIIGLLKIIAQANTHVFSPFFRRADGAWKAKICYLFGASVALSLIIPVFRSIILRFDAPDLTQGRYLFTVMIPVSVLTIFGLFALFPQKSHRWVGGIGLFSLILLDTVALVNYLLLNFHYVAFF